MGTLVGHVLPGLFFLSLGFWHLFNHIKLHSLHPNSFSSSAWFPISKSRYLELFLIILASSLSVSMELFIAPERHTPFDPDGTIPSTHLHNFEHSFISMSFLTYATFALLLDIIKINPKAKHGLIHFLAAVAFSQELLLFHLHSTDHMGVEGQYHLLLQAIIVVSLVSTLIGIGFPKSFMVCFVRSLSIFYQGLWLIVMGYTLWTPEFVSKGCFIHDEEGHQLVRCSSDEALHRAKSLVNILFSWTTIVVTVYAMVLYLVLVKLYGGKVEYSTLTIQEENDVDDVESQKEIQKLYAVIKN